jgi:hypothetical protein
MENTEKLQGVANRMSLKYHAVLEYQFIGINLYIYVSGFNLYADKKRFIKKDLTEIFKEYELKIIFNN